MLAITAIVQPGPASAGIALALAAASLVVLAMRRGRLSGTTLTAPWAWTVGALVAVAGAELFDGWLAAERPGWLSPLRYAAAMTAFCPLMALLGAKRPQDRAWQFVVATLWVLLAVPAGEALLFRPGEPVHVPAAWSWLLVVLMLLSLVNYLPTRFWHSGILVFLGQLALVWGYLPWADRLPRLELAAVPLACFAAAIGLAAASRPGSAAARSPIDRVWIDFRDWFGAVWALRVAERMRASAQMYGWNLRFGWSGAASLDPQQDLPAETRAEVEKGLRSMLRRFVSPDWIARRAAGP